MVQDFRELPKLRDSWTYLYVEHCKVDREDKAIAIHDADGRVPVPCANLALLMIGPGTSITHAAISTLAECGCSVLWTGEQGVRVYAQGVGETRSSSSLLRQVAVYSDPEAHMRMVFKLYAMRFPEPLPEGITLQQLRGREGVRVREAYAQASRETGVPWTGRSYDRTKWSDADPVNRALSAANSCLYGLCHAAIVSLGYSPALGFIHTGRQLSFVYDIADLYKVGTTIPAAFAAVASGEMPVETTVRKMCRDNFVRMRLLARIVEDLESLFGHDESTAEPCDTHDPAVPGALWDPRAGQLQGGHNYADPGAGEESKL
ncbi:MAG: type I-E CRISPR-associated endonuclease Cas1e [Firmicutes bacterium]|nr:type I-E CRISPR-associated endonuclease Cas1e [Bacillota bacterium]